MKEDGMAGFELAQINIARFRLPPEHVANRDFMDALDHVNAVAEASDGFIWRLTGDGNDATDVPVTDDPHLIANMSVWRDLDALAAFVYRRPDHLAVMKRRKERSEEHTSELQSLMRTSYAVFCLKQKKHTNRKN